jgi:hypothetical protein
MQPPSRKLPRFFTGIAKRVSREKIFNKFFFRMQQNSIGKNGDDQQNDIYQEIVLVC